MPRNEKNPKTSAKVVTITPDPRAGSRRIALSARGTAAPIIPVTAIVITIAVVSAAPIHGLPTTP
jgi:hypothetical protein